MSFEAILIGWCAASLLAAGGLVVWFVVELRILRSAISARRRGQRLTFHPNISFRGPQQLRVRTAP